MILFPTPSEKDLDLINRHIPRFTKLDNGQTIHHPWYLTGGGDQYYPYFLEAVKHNGRPHYSKAFEWCVGHGRIGWEMITRNIFEEWAFNDYYNLAVNTTLENAKNLGYENVSRGYITPTITDIPDNEKFDLVIGNPPNSMDKEFMIEQCIKGGQDYTLINLALRITVDQDFLAHKDFFENIGSHLTPDADIFISMHETVVSYLLETVITPAGFKLVSVTDMFPQDPHLKIIHFKQI